MSHQNIVLLSLTSMVFLYTNVCAQENESKLDINNNPKSFIGYLTFNNSLNVPLLFEGDFKGQGTPVGVYDCKFYDFDLVPNYTDSIIFLNRNWKEVHVSN